MSEDLFEAAKAVREHAHAPYSKFAVGAAIRTASGAVVAGANVENASYPESCCAETAAIARMVAEGETEIAEILVVADADPAITPCGGCRQRIAEFAAPGARVHAADLGGVRRTFTIAELLPAAFALAEDRK